MSTVYVSVNDVRKACLASSSDLSRVFQAPRFFLEYNRLGFYTGVDKETWTPCFLLAAPAAHQLVQELQEKHGCNLAAAQQCIAAQHNQHKYDREYIQPVHIPTEAMYKAITKSFTKIAKQSKSQALYSECRVMLREASLMAHPQDPHSSSSSNRRCGVGVGPVYMFLALDFEWWERSADVILEVGWSMWDTLSQHHRTRHWVIKENLNKSNGRFISDNRMRFSFGSSGRGSLDSAMNALQEEVDARGVTDGLTRHQRDALQRSDIVLVLVGHGMGADMECAELHEIEWPPGITIYDTQKLFMAWQLKQLDAAAATKALEAAVAGEGKGGKAAGDNDGGDLLSDDDDDDDSDGFEGSWAEAGGVDDEPVAAATRGLRELGLKNGSSGKANGGSSGNGRPNKGKPQVQNPKRVRPWPAGPPSSDNKPQGGVGVGGSRDQTGPAGAGAGVSSSSDKIDRQVGLAGLLSALGIRFGKLHNAGNDARFTMEAFLALAGHPPCVDPAGAHLASMSQDSTYQQELEASMQAAAAQGWGTPTTTPPPGSGASTPPYSGSTQGAGGGGGGGAARGASTTGNYRNNAGGGGGGGSSRGGGDVGGGPWSSRVSSTTGSECGSCSETDWALHGAAGRPAAAPAGRSAVPPGFAPRASPLGIAAAHPAHAAVPHGHVGHRQDDDDDVPPGFPGATRVTHPASAAGAWGGAAGPVNGAPAAAAAGAWGPGGAAARGLISVAAGSSNGSRPGWAKSPPGSSAGGHPAHGGGAAAPAGVVVVPVPQLPQPGRQAAGGEWGVAAAKQVGGFGAFNSSTGRGAAAPAYDPNPDGW